MLKFGLWIICVVMASAAVAAPPEDVVHVQAQWNMSLDANGKITVLEPRPGRVKDVLRKVLETAIRSWEFESGSINGKSAATDTILLVSISLWPTKGDEGYAVRVDNVTTGGGVAKIGKMPNFPLKEVYKARREKTNSVVMLVLTYDEDGKPLEVSVAENSPTQNGPLVAEAIKATLTWRFHPERVDGHGIKARAILPICYAAVNDSPTGSDCDYPSEKGEAPFESGSSIALESSVSLKSDVVGKTL